MDKRSREKNLRHDLDVLNHHTDRRLVHAPRVETLHEGEAVCRKDGPAKTLPLGKGDGSTEGYSLDDLGGLNTREMLPTRHQACS
jgi:hypothetical protein